MSRPILQSGAPLGWVFGIAGKCVYNTATSALLLLPRTAASPALSPVAALLVGVGGGLLGLWCAGWGAPGGVRRVGCAGRRPARARLR
ncbi:MAG: hypothetical protein KGS73_02440 [Chloroflexi bacterium]|nr:hypothetical protein [Chloroflexota bacterium]